MLDDILNRVARVGAMHAGNRPNPPADRPQTGQGKPPTSPGKTIKHKSFLGALAGAIAGALVAAAVAAAAVVLVGVTGGLAVAAVGALAVFAAGDLISAVSGKVSAMVDSASPAFGPVATGSANVFAEKQPIARAEVDTVACTKHNSPQLIAQGSETVYVNGHPAARIDDQTVCGATIKEGASTVFFGSGQQTCLEIADEFSWWEKAILIAVEFLVPPGRGLIKGIGKLFTRGPGAVLKGVVAGAKFAAKRTASKAKCAAKAFKQSRGLARTKEAAKAFKKDPIYIASGEVIEQRIDLELGQTLPLCFERTYLTASSHQGLLGKGWHDNWSEVATVSHSGLEETVVITLAGGYNVDFTFYQDQQRVFCPHYPALTLERRHDGFHLWDRDSRTWRAFTVAQGERRLLSALSDPHDNRIDFIRDPQGYLRYLRHSDGIELTLIWRGDFLHHVVRTDNAQRIQLLRYEQDDQGRLQEADAAQGYHLRYEYDAHNRLTRWHDNDKTWARYEYDKQGRCVYTTCADGFMTARFDYFDQRVVMTDGHGHRSEFGFNDLDLISWEKSPLGHVTRYDYDEWGNLLRETSPSGRVVAFSYLGDTGLVSTFTDGSGYVWQYDYDAEERLCGVTDPLDRSWRWAFDSSGNPEKLTGPDASEVHFTWNRHGLLTQVSDQAGEVQARLNYDHRKRLLSASDGEGRTQQLRYDIRDRLVQVQQADGARFRLGYRRESWKLPEQLIRPDEREEQLSYDRHKNLLSYVDGNGAQWLQAYGAFDLMKSRTDARGQTWRYEYDRESQQLTGITAPDGSRWQWWLDADSRVVRERDMAGTETTYAYDEDGLCIAVINGEGEQREFLYDGRGLLLRETADGQRTEYSYDAVARLTEVISAQSHTRLEYDARDRVVREWHNGREIQRDYDDSSRTLTRTLSWSEEEAEQGESLTSAFRYSRTGELQQVQLPDGAELTIHYDQAGREIQRQSGDFAQRKAYDVMGWLVREMSGRQQDGRLQAEQAREYRHDGAGNITGMRSNREAQGYRLDACGRVLSVLTGGANRSTETTEQYSYTRTGLPQDEGRLTQWQGGRLVRQDNIHYQYDRAGRLVRKLVHHPGYRPKQWQYQWDSRNQLTGVVTPDGTRWRYQYDAFGRRTSKHSDTTDVVFLWDGNQIAEVRCYTDGRLQQRRHWVHNGWELLVQQRQQADALWETDFVTSSQNGAPQALYGSDGQLCWQAPHIRLWGVRRAESDGLDPGLAFAGQYRDSESGLCYNRFRYYDPDGAQYISPDPIGVMGGLNQYAYAPNTLSWIDPLGLKCDGAKSSYEQARNNALKWLEDRGFKAEKVNTGKFGTTKGKPVGMTTIDGKTGFRIEYDERSGAHINVFSGKDKGGHYFFDAQESTVTKLQDLFNLPSKPWRGVS